MPAPSKKFAALAGILGVAAATTLVNFTGTNEGNRLVPYQDVIKHWTVCHGETNIPMRIYTQEECDQILISSLLLYTQHVRDFTPGFDDLPWNVKIAAIDFAYNLGTGTYDRSSLRTKLEHKQVSQACSVFEWYKFAGGKDCSQKGNGCPGVWNRRIAERKMCLSGM